MLGVDAKNSMNVCFAPPHPKNTTHNLCGWVVGIQYQFGHILFSFRRTDFGIFVIFDEKRLAKLEHLAGQKVRKKTQLETEKLEFVGTHCSAVGVENPKEDLQIDRYTYCIYAKKVRISVI